MNAEGAVIANATGAGVANGSGAVPGDGPDLPRPARRWVERGAPDPDATARLRATLNLPDALCRLLVVRGHADESAARDYLKPRLDQMHDPGSLAGIADAVDRIDRAIRNGEVILVHGDYDVDGICGAALLTRVLRSFGASITPFTPHRLHDGYDLSAAGVRAAMDARARLILTADCGTTAHDAVSMANAAGIDVIITDHHTPGATLPDAVAVVNPNRPDSAYPDRSLAGAGVAFKLCHAIAAARGVALDSLWYYLDLVAVATIADLAPLRGENRIFTRFGLRLLRETRNPGLRALMVEARIDCAKPIAGGQISHVLAPRINAVGRMGDAMRGVELLLTEEEDRAAVLARTLEEENRVRKEVDRQTLREALNQLEGRYDPDVNWGLVLGSPGWHPGVIGIVASRVVERLHRPTVLLSIDPTTGRARGSARSIAGFHLYEAIRACSPLLERFGGHRQAAGMDLRIDRIDAFREAFNAHAHEVLEPDDLVERVPIDVHIQLAEASLELGDLLRHFGPFGMGNPAPVFVARGLRLVRPPRTVGEGHLKLLFGDDTGRLDAIGFSMAERLPAATAEDRWDVAFHLNVDEWNDRRRVQARLIDLVRSA
ncbi:MAG: single-stranded-DNA-specific exonuclease RecJ [Gemmatimonadetes bacterium]|nr:single-stranded-DNA-specific exonuclease RecJ [Gemmatimonadota bacterium]